MVRRIQAAGEWAIKQRYDANESRLMPTDIMPNASMMQDTTNNGNPSMAHTAQ